MCWWKSSSGASDKAEAEPSERPSRIPSVAKGAVDLAATVGMWSTRRVRAAIVSRARKTPPR